VGIANFLLFLGRQPIEFLAILQNLLLLCRTQILKTPRLQITRIRWPVRIETRLPGGLVASIWRAIPADHAHRFRLWALRFPVRRNVTLRPAIVFLNRRRQFRQRLEVRKQVVILQHWNIFLRNLRWIVRGVRRHPNRRQRQYRRSKRRARRREPGPPDLLQRLRRHSRAHAHIKRRRRFDHRQLIQQTAHSAKFIHAQTARGARREVLFHLQPLAFLQAPVHVSQNFMFHPAAAHDFPFLAQLLLPLLRYEGGEFHSQRFVCPEQQRLQRAFRALQNFRNLSVIQLLILVQQHRRALFLRKLFNGVTDHLFARFLHQVLLDVRVLLGDVQRLLFAFFRI